MDVLFRPHLVDTSCKAVHRRWLYAHSVASVASSSKDWCPPLNCGHASLQSHGRAQDVRSQVERLLAEGKQQASSPGGALHMAGASLPTALASSAAPPPEVVDGSVQVQLSRSSRVSSLFVLYIVHRA